MHHRASLPIWYVRLADLDLGDPVTAREYISYRMRFFKPGDVTITTVKGKRVRLDKMTDREAVLIAKQLASRKPDPRP